MHLLLASLLDEKIKQQKHKRISGIHSCATINNTASLSSMNLKTVIKKKKLNPKYYFDYIQLYPAFTKAPEI